MSIEAAEVVESTRVTKLGVFAGRVIEAGWLAVAMIVPLYFTPFQGPSFEGPKTQLFRVIVAIMALAWIVKVHEEGSWRQQGETLRRNPLTVPLALFALLSVLSTLTSVAPTISLWGMTPRYQGLYTTLSLLAFFFLVALQFRERAQLERLVTTLLATSLVVSLYAFLQYWDLDPVRGTTFEITRLEHRVASSLGQHIFLGAYLLFVIPLAVARLLDAWRAWRTAPDTQDMPQRWRRDLLVWTGILLLVHLSLYGFLVRASVADQKTLWWTFEGVLAALLLVVGWGLVITRPLPPQIRGLCYAGLLLIQGIALLLSLARGPWLAMVAGGFTFFVLYAFRYRLRKVLLATLAATLLVCGFLALLNLPQSPLTPLKSHPILRRLGNLWEVEEGAGRQRLNIWQTSLKAAWEHPPLTVPDRLNLLRPVLGYGPETFLMVFERVLPRSMGKRDSWTPRADRAHNHLLQLLVTQGLAGVLVYLAMVGWFLVLAFRKMSRLEGFSCLFVIAAISAVVAEMVELQVGILLTVTTALFSLFMGVVSAMEEGETASMAQPAAEAAPAAQGRAKDRRARRAPPAPRRITIPRWPVWAMVAYLALTLLGQILFAQPLSADSVGPGLVASLSWMMLGIGLLAAALGTFPTGPWWRGWSQSWVPVAAVVGVLLLVSINLNLVRADISFLFGQDLARQRRFEDSVVMYQRAIRLNPSQESYYQGLAEALVGLVQKAPQGERVRGEPPPESLLMLSPARVRGMSRDALTVHAVASQRQAWRVNPLDPAMGYYLTKTLEFQAVLGYPERFQEALAIYRQISQMSPNRIRLYHDWIMAALRAGRLEEAQEVARTVEALSPTHPLVEATMAILYRQLGRADEAREEARKALSHPLPPRAEYLRILFNILRQGFPDAG